MEYRERFATQLETLSNIVHKITKGPRGTSKTVRVQQAINLIEKQQKTLQVQEWEIAALKRFAKTNQVKGR